MTDKLQEIYDLAKCAEIIVFGTKYCKYCKLAQTFLENIVENDSYISYYYVDLDLYDDSLKEYLYKANDWSTIPMIFVRVKDSKYQFMGGYTELCTLF